MDPHRAEFERILDELNELTQSRGLPEKLRHDVRSYFFECEELWKCQAQQEVIRRMSPSMQGTVSLAICSAWIQNVPYFQEILRQGHALPMSAEFFVQISHALEQRIYPKGESLTEVAMYIIQKGTVTNGARVLVPGDVFGDDIILSNPENRRTLVPCAITTVSTLQMTREPLMDILDRFPKQEAIVRKYVAWLAVKRGMVRELKRFARQSGVTHTASGRKLAKLRQSKSNLSEVEGATSTSVANMHSMMQDFLEKGNGIMQSIVEIRESLHAVESTQQKLVQQVNANNIGMRATWERIQRLEASQRGVVEKLSAGAGSDSKSPKQQQKQKESFDASSSTRSVTFAADE
eukprot:gnl/MRDRNA2_/MRDRNA2_15480_c0_seq1.p1 gnl/MRDRNA2_/MRDRNA2_15480_c0~~gnl/MRDRNA2_/MRDRNA2_15480_c0_seq1.p1  ORF type:complete len:377 (+),score=66.31 gnl/MRDRNA2_/MRDRNA2_15480_c0_seq1:85-1131(+)